MILENMYTKQIVCPHCGYTFTNSHECGYEGWEEDWEEECPECDKKFQASRNIEITYCTEIIK